ncbi:MAG: hypothetical protein ACLU8D_10135 [Enterocloster sp.]
MAAAQRIEREAVQKIKLPDYPLAIYSGSCTVPGCRHLPAPGTGLILPKLGLGTDDGLLL